MQLNLGLSKDPSRWNLHLGGLSILLKEGSDILQWKPSEGVVSTLDCCSHEGSQRYDYEWKCSLPQLKDLSGKARKQ